MDQADAQYSYMLNQEYHWREDRCERNNKKVEADGGGRATKGGKHDRTKLQTEMIGKQKFDCISGYYDADLSTVTSITDINKGGRRVQDKHIAEGKED